MTTKEMSDFLNGLWCWARCTEEEQRKLSEIADYLSSRGNEKNDCISRIGTIDYLCKRCPDDGECFKDCDEIKHLRQMPPVTPQEPQLFKWCTDCKEYDQEKHCCHRYSKVIRDTVAEITQESFKPMVEIDLYSVIKQKYIEREVLDKIRAEIENINVWGMRYEPDTYLDKRPQIVQKVKDHVIEIIDKYKAETEDI
jgi:hypothetical protein